MHEMLQIVRTDLSASLECGPSSSCNNYINAMPTIPTLTHVKHGKEESERGVIDNKGKSICGRSFSFISSVCHSRRCHHHHHYAVYPFAMSRGMLWHGMA